jgi:hypothetical protein
LHRWQKVVEMLLQTLDGTSASAAGVDELLDAGVTDADNGELGGYKESIERHQQHNH